VTSALRPAVGQLRDASASGRPAGARPGGPRLSDRGAAVETAVVVAVAVLAAALAVLDGPAPLRLPVGLLAVLILPGLSLCVAVFPRANDLADAERIGLSFGLSLAAITIVTLGLSYTPWGLAVTPLILAITLWTVVAMAVRLWRQSSLTPAARFSIAGGLAQRMEQFRRSWKIATALVGLGALGGTVMAFTLVDRPLPNTELFILGSDELDRSYPYTARPSEPLTVVVGITSREPEPASFTVLVDTVGNRLATVGPIDIAPGQSWSAPVTFALTDSGNDQLVTFQLFKAHQLGAYRLLQLWIDVLPPAPLSADRVSVATGAARPTATADLDARAGSGPGPVPPAGLVGR